MLTLPTHPHRPPAAVAEGATLKIDNHVTAIIPVKGMIGGRAVEDSFSIKSKYMLEKLMAPYNKHERGIDHFYLTKHNNGLYLFPWLTFTLKTSRSLTGENMPSLLIVTGQVLKIVHSAAATIIKFDMKRGRDPAKADDVNYNDVTCLTHKIGLAYTIIKLSENKPQALVPPALRAFAVKLLVDANQELPDGIPEKVVRV